MNPATRYNSNTIEQKLLPLRSNKPLEFSSLDHARKIDSANWALGHNKYSKNRRPFEHFGSEEKNILTKYTHGIEELLLDYNPYDTTATPNLGPSNDLKVLRDAARFADQYGMTFDDLLAADEVDGQYMQDLKKLAARNEHAFGEPVSLLKGAHEQKKLFYEGIWDLYTRDSKLQERTSADQPFATGDLLELTYDLFGTNGESPHKRTENYLAFTHLQLDAEYVTAAVLNKAKDIEVPEPHKTWYHKMFGLQPAQPEMPPLLRFADRYQSKEKLLGQRSERLQAAMNASGLFFYHTSGHHT